MAFDADTPFLKHAQDLSLLCHFKGFERCAKVTIFQFQHLPCVSTPFQVNSMSCLWSGFNHDGQRPRLTSGLNILTFHWHGCRSSYSCCHRCFDCDRSRKFHKNHLHYSFQSPICAEHQECLTSASMKWETSLSVMQVVKCLISAQRAHHQTNLWHSPFKAKGEVGCEALSPSLNQQHQKSNVQTASAKATSWLVWRKTYVFQPQH